MSHSVSVDRYSTRKKTNKCKTCCRKFVAFIFSHVGLSGLVVGYSIMGAFAFKALEAPHEEEKNHEVSELRKQTVSKLWDITEKYNVLYKDNWTRDVGSEIRQFQDLIIQAVKDGYDGRDGKTTHYQWTLSGGFLYSLTVITTIGYGNIAPRTEWGKIVTIIYAIVGIPLMLLYLANIGDILAKSFKYIYKRICRCGICSNQQNKNVKNRRQDSTRIHNLTPQNSIVKKNSKYRQNSQNRQESLYRNAFQDRTSDKPYHGPEEEIGIESLTEGNQRNGEEKEEKITVPITLCLIIMVAYIFGGALLFSLWEEWDYLDGSYFCFITLSTIGFGDLVPGDKVISDNPDSQEKLVFCSLYVLIGMALIAMCFNLMQEEVISKMKSLGRKCGIVKDDDD